MQKNLTPLLLTVGILALAGCSKETNFARSFYTEAGSELDTSDFGNSTRSNTMVQSGEIDYVIDLTRKFGADVQNTVNFEFNSAVLDEAARTALMQQADWIRQFPEVRFRVYGHTDLVGSDAYNKSLGLKRAQAVVAFLSTQGISRSRLEAVASFGETQPLVAIETEDRRNRRTVTEVSGFVNSSDMLLNGKYAAIVMREYITSGSPPTVTADPTTGDSSSGSGASGG